MLHAVPLAELRTGYSSAYVKILRTCKPLEGKPLIFEVEGIDVGGHDLRRNSERQIKINIAKTQKDPTHHPPY